jgi:hypothetical protein
MKRSLIPLFLLLIMGTPALKGQAALLVLIFGDKAATENFHFSMKLGMNYSIIHGYDEGKNGMGVNFGVVNNIRLTDKFTLLAEFLPLSARSIRDVPVVTTGNPELDSLLIDVKSTDRRLSYIDVPILLKVKLSERFSLSAGPQISFLTGATDTYKSAPIKGAELTSEIDIKSNLRSVDVAAVIDLMYILVPPKSGKGINLFFRYSKGFIDIGTTEGLGRQTASLIQVGATFPFVQKVQE